MSRRKKACEFCEDDVFSDFITHRNGYCLWAEWYPDKGLLAVISQANDEEGELIEDAVEFSFEYCPMCGRGLERI